MAPERTTPPRRPEPNERAHWDTDIIALGASSVQTLILLARARVASELGFPLDQLDAVQGQSTPSDRRRAAEVRS